MDLDLRDKVFLVTGAAAGLGLATAGVLLAEGARVVISCRTRHAVDKAAADLGRPDCIVGIAADNADPDSADRLVTAALTRFGRLDGVLVSVGGPPTGPLTAITDQQWRTSFGRMSSARGLMDRQFHDLLRCIRPVGADENGDVARCEGGLTL